MKKLKALFLGTAVLMSSILAKAEESLPTVMLYKTPACGCCTEWAKHMEENGFKVMSHDVPGTATYRAKAGIPKGMESCHTAFIGDYAFEGHVPAADIKRLLTEKPDGVNGLTVPGMPMGSPGMEYGDLKDPYKVIGFSSDGKMSVFATH
ncbi:MULTISPECIES: DUF411 domain-containing protein [unclassified Endozoicomonas]|uniref:DUF411 domain-containing protein n=1 Tax=unclassified Endozoicomonas TaxID=2644528 RepID=UPI0021479448|nr:MULTISPECIES: DUF411 domain-containing protein [unclassified Endozoicomonas]